MSGILMENDEEEPSSIIKTKLLWVIILSAIAIIVLPLFVIWFLLVLPDIVRVIATFLIIICWGIAAGYKDWILAKSEEEEK